MNRAEQIMVLLQERLQAEQIEIEDDSAAHAGHAGALTGAGHFKVMIVSPLFTGLNRIARHRLVYDALSVMIPGDIHALNISAKTPREASLSE